MITYITTFEEQRNTSFTNEVVSFSRTTEYYQYDTFSDTFAVNGVHTETSTSSYSVSSTSASEYVTTYLSTYTVNVTTYTTSTGSDTYAIGTYVSSYDTYNTTGYGFETSTYFTDWCSVVYSVETNSYTSGALVSPYGFVSYTVYETTTHNYPYPHSISRETYSSAIYTTSSTYDTYITTSSTYSYTIGTVVWTTETWSDYPYTTLTTTYDTTVSSSTSFVDYISTSYTNGVYETYIADTKETSSSQTFISVFQNGSVTSYTSWTTESNATYLTITYIQSYSYFFGYISKGGAGLTTSNYTESHSKSSLNSYTNGLHSQTYLENITTAQTSGYSFSVSDWGGSTSYTTYSTDSSSGVTSYGGSTTFAPSASTFVTTTNSYVTYSVTTTITSSTNVNQTGTIYTGTTTSILGATLNTTRTTAITNTIPTTTSSVVSSTSWSNDGYYSQTNTVPMRTAYVFERTPPERMFTLSSTSSSFVVLSELVGETTRYSAIPNYTTNPSNSESLAYVSSGSSITTQSGITETAFVVSEYSYGTPSITISEVSGIASSPVGAYGYPATSITYAKGIYDITSRTMSDSLVGTNTTVRSTVTDSFVSEAIVNGDKRIHPRMTIVANTTASSATVFSLLGAFAFTTTSLANP